MMTIDEMVDYLRRCEASGCPPDCALDMLVDEAARRETEDETDRLGRAIRRAFQRMAEAA